MDLAQKVHFLALDVITDLSYGSPIGDLTSDEDNYRHLEATGETLGVLSFFVATGLMKILLIPRVHRMMFSEQDEKGWGKFQG